MSSHREAPEISKDPVADSTDVYAFVSPDHPNSVTLIANYIPLEGPAGGPNFYSFGDDVLYEIHVDNDGDGQADVTYQFRFDDRAAGPGHLPVQHRPDPVARQPELEQPPVLHRHPRAARAERHAGPAPRLPAVQHRPAVHAGLRAAGAGGGAPPLRRDQGVRRPAGRGLLRGPRRDLRPGRPAAVRAAARPVRHARLQQAGRGRQRHRRGERALDRHPGAHLGADRQGPGDRRVDDREPPAGASCGTPRSTRTSAAARSSRCPGWATRWSTRC